MEFGHLYMHVVHKQIRSFKSSIILNMHISFSETKKKTFCRGLGEGGGGNKNRKICF